MIDPQQNWSGHHPFSAARVHRPASVDQVQELVSRGRKLKVFGARHFTWKKDWPGAGKLLPLLEEQLAPFKARPHWGKLFTLPPARLRALYEKLPDFRQLLRHYDPQGKFRNAFLDTYIFGTD